MISKALSGSKMGWTEGAGAGEELCVALWEVREVRHSVSSQLEGQLTAGRSGLGASHRLPRGGKWEVSPALRSAMED